jgi:hypothetical protein
MQLQAIPEEIDTTYIADVQEVQIVNYPAHPVGKSKVSLVGVIERAQNAYHYTPVFLYMKQPPR